ncbi:MAG TPA: outer membrane protein transport protein [Candidatus Cloacimonadota bacterium]|nr:outer membrane protein transport protein [Candidatus Cloacimonadota bacterium]
MKNNSIMIMLILLIVSTGSLFGAGFALSGQGSRATAMGGAFRGLADDATAMFWNPAGLGFMNETSASLGGTFILPSSNWEPTAAVPGIPSATYESKKKLRAFPSIFLVEDTEKPFKWGFSAYVPYGLGATWDAYTLPTTMPTSPTTQVDITYAADFPEEEMMSSLAIIDAHPTVAYQITPKLSAGLGISLMYGMVEIQKIKPFTLPAPLNTMNPWYSPMTINLDGTGIGIGANLGLLYKATPALSIGLTGKTPSKLYMDGEAELYLWLNSAVSGMMGSPDPIKSGGTDDIKTEINLPGELAVGFSYKIKPNWALNLDYAYTLWSGLDKATITMDDSIMIMTSKIEETELNFSWKDTSRVSLGTEYWMGVNALRAGMYFEQSAIPDETLSPTFPDINNKLSLNLGYGRVFGPLTLDLNGQVNLFQERKIETQSADNMTGTYNANVISGNLGLTYKF